MRHYRRKTILARALSRSKVIEMRQKYAVQMRFNGKLEDVPLASTIGDVAGFMRGARRISGQSLGTTVLLETGVRMNGLEDPCDYTSWSASRWKADLFAALSSARSRPSPLAIPLNKPGSM